MIRSRQFWSRHCTALAVLLACAQLVSLVGFPAFSRSSAEQGRCGKSCGCFTVSDSAPCCCSTGKRTLPTLEVESCCSSKTAAAKSCCAKKKLEEPKTEIFWVVGLFARNCQGESSPAGLPAMEPAVPPMAAIAVSFERLPSDALFASDSNANSLPSIPPDPPPRTVG